MVSFSVLICCSLGTSIPYASAYLNVCPTAKWDTTVLSWAILYGSKYGILGQTIPTIPTAAMTHITVAPGYKG